MKTSHPDSRYSFLCPFHQPPSSSLPCCLQGQRPTAVYLKHHVTQAPLPFSYWLELANEKHPQKMGGSRREADVCFLTFFWLRTHFLAMAIFPSLLFPLATTAPVRSPQPQLKASLGSRNTMSASAPSGICWCLHMLVGPLSTPLLTPSLHCPDPCEVDSVSCWALIHDGDAARRWVLGAWSS